MDEAQGVDGIYKNTFHVATMDLFQANEGRSVARYSKNMISTKESEESSVWVAWTELMASYLSRSQHFPSCKIVWGSFHRPEDPFGDSFEIACHFCAK